MSLDRLPPRRLRDLLEDLEGLAARTRRGEEQPIPSLTVELLGGQTLSGRFIAFSAAERDGATLVPHSQGTRGGLDAAYVPLNSVAALIVHHGVETLPALSSGRIAPPAGDAPGRLVIERQAAEFGQRRSLRVTLDWPALGSGDGARSAAARVLHLLPEALDAVTSDALGREALAGVTGIAISTGEYGSIARSGDVLSIFIRRADGQDYPPDATDLLNGLLAAL